jgi:hypothetical protein
VTTRRVPPTIAIGAVSVLITASLFGVLRWEASRRAMTVGFWFEPSALMLPDDVAAQLGGPLSADEKSHIERLSRAEIARAFAGLQLRLTDDGSGFWRVQVLPSLAVGRRRVFPVAGASFGFGPLGGRASLGFNLLAITASSVSTP